MHTCMFAFCTSLINFVRLVCGLFGIFFPLPLNGKLAKSGFAIASTAAKAQNTMKLTSNGHSCAEGFVWAAPRRRNKILSIFKWELLQPIPYFVVIASHTLWHGTRVHKDPNTQDAANGFWSVCIIDGALSSCSPRVRLLGLTLVLTPLPRHSTCLSIFILPTFWCSNTNLRRFTWNFIYQYFSVVRTRRDRRHILKSFSSGITEMRRLWTNRYAITFNHIKWNT